MGPLHIKFRSLYVTRESLYGFTCLDGRRPGVTRMGTNTAMGAPNTCEDIREFFGRPHLLSGRYLLAASHVGPARA